MRTHYLVLSLVLTWVVPGLAYSLELGLGLSAVEEGDNRMRPAVMTHVGFLKHYYSHVYYYGRKFGPVTERTVVVSAVRRLPLFKMLGINFIKGAMGIALMDEQIVIDIEDDPVNSDTENNFNVGAVFAAIFNIPIPGPMFARFNWESHLFLAGPEAGLLLANGRKQMISLSAGVRL